MLIAEIIGYIAAVFLSILFIPQVYKTYKSKNASSLSIIFLFLEVITCVLFISYGFLIKAVPVIIANFAALICNILLVIAKLTFKKIDNNEDNPV